MRYWVYINNKVDGPYDENKLVTLTGFSQDTLICSEEVASKGGQEWVKASSVFEFDEVPVQEPVVAPNPIENNTSSHSATTALDASLLLSKLNALTDELSVLHNKLDSMQTDLDKALEQNEQLAQKIALHEAQDTPTTPAPAAELNRAENSSTPEPIDTLMPETNTQEQPESFPEQAAPREEELIIRSALDSIYGEKPIQAPSEDETFQDLLPQKEEEQVEKIEKELTFTPVEEKKEEQPQPEQAVKEALITTPSAEESLRDELINELTASPKEDVLDQIIQEHQAQEADAASVENKDSLTGAAIAGTAAVAGLAGLAALSEEKKEDFQHVSTAEEAAGSFSMATDKNNPEFFEEVLPAAQMPADAPAEQSKNDTNADLVMLPTTDSLEEQPAVSQEVPVEEKVDFVEEDTLQELVPGATFEKEQPNIDNKAIEEKNIPTEEATKEETSETQPEVGAITEKDLSDAFGPMDESASSTMTEVPDNQNPNDLTEIELKEGSTYLISDFVPPAQVGDDAAAINALGATFNQTLNKQQETIIQDMLAVSNKAEKTQILSTEGLPVDAEATRVSLENTIQAKRGASLDIKTAPMVPEPTDSPRLNVDELTDVNAQHEVKKGTSGMKLTKIVIGALITLLLLIILYVALGIMNMLPQSVNVFSKKQAQAPSVSQELLPETTVSVEQEIVDQPEENVDANTQVLLDVQNLALPNDMTLKQFVESKHSTIDPALISWEVADAVEPDNYAITIKVPPENPQNFKTVYRFNYNAENGLLEPTISDAKNLLDQVYGTQN